MRGRVISANQRSTIQPRTARRDEVHVEPGMARQPAASGRAFMRTRVVEHQVELQIGRRFRVESLEKFHELPRAAAPSRVLKK